MTTTITRETTAEDLVIEAADIAQMIWPNANTVDWAPRYLDDEDVLVGLTVIDEGVPVELCAARAEGLDYRAEKKLRAELAKVLDRLDDTGYDFGAPGPAWNRLYL